MKTLCLNVCKRCVNRGEAVAVLCFKCIDEDRNTVGG